MALLNHLYKVVTLRVYGVIALIALILSISAGASSPAYATNPDAYLYLTPINSGYAPDSGGYTLNPGGNFAISVYANSTNSQYGSAEFAFDFNSSGPFTLDSIDTSSSRFNVDKGSGTYSPGTNYGFICLYAYRASTAPLLGKSLLATFNFHVNQNATPGTYTFTGSYGACRTGIWAPEPDGTSVWAPYSSTGTVDVVIKEPSQSSKTPPSANPSNSSTGSNVSTPPPNSTPSSTSHADSPLANSSEGAPISQQVAKTSSNNTTGKGTNIGANAETNLHSSTVSRLTSNHLVTIVTLISFIGVMVALLSWKTPPYLELTVRSVISRSYKFAHVLLAHKKDP